MVDIQELLLMLIMAIFAIQFFSIKPMLLIVLLALFLFKLTFRAIIGLIVAILIAFGKLNTPALLSPGVEWPLASPRLYLRIVAPLGF